MIQLGKILTVQIFLLKIFCVPCDISQVVILEVPCSGSAEWNAASL